jgi:hypothetical protein
MHTDSSLQAWGATLQQGGGVPSKQGMYEQHGHWDTALLRAHITLLELRSVLRSLEEFAKAVMFQMGDVIKLHTDNKMCYYVMAIWTSRSPAVVVELRMIHRYLLERGIQIEVKHLPSALNLYADRLSRPRRSYDFLPQMDAVLESTWVGASGHDWAKPWPTNAMIPPP